MEWLPPPSTDGSEPAPRRGHSFTRLLNSPLILLFGGDVRNSQVTNEMYCYHTDRSFWRHIKYAYGPTPSPRMLHTATAISSHVIVVFGGDLAQEKHDSSANLARSTNETWVFDIRDCSWREIKTQESKSPKARSCHTAVFAPLLGHVPAVYLYGGFGSHDGKYDSMWRLRIGDWTWERLQIRVKDEKGKEYRVYNREELTATQQVSDETLDNSFPCERESHAATWVPRLQGMLVIGGDGRLKMLDDVWLFTPSSDRSVWQWKKLNLRRARGLLENVLPNLTGHSLIPLPTDTPQILIWGGMQGKDGKSFMPAEKSYLIDLAAMQSVMIPCKGNVETGGRLLQSMAIVNDQVISFGGCDQYENQVAGLTIAKLRSDILSYGKGGIDFGSQAARAAAGQQIKYDENGDPADEDDWKEEKESAPKIPLVSPSDIPKGTPLTGKIIESTDIGHYVSVVIEGKLYKGVLVANPLKKGETEKEEKEKAKETEDEIQPANAEKKEVEVMPPPPKKPRHDVIADILPDAPPKTNKDDTVIEIE